MEPQEAIKLLQQRNLNYCIKKGNTDHYSKETDEIISAFVRCNNTSVQRGQALHTLKLMLQNIADHPEIAGALAQQTLDYLKRNFDK